MIEPKRPTGTDPESLYCQWLHDQIKQMQPIEVRGQQMGKTTRGQYLIQTQNKVALPPIVRVSDNMLQYLFDHHELTNTVYDGAMVLTGVRSGLMISGGRLPYLRDVRDLDAGPDTIHLKIEHSFTLTLTLNSDPPFYTGTRGSVLGDYTGGVSNPVDPVTISKYIPWKIKLDDASLAWARGSSAFLASLPDAFGWTDPAPFTGDQTYADYQFSFGSPLAGGISVQHLTLSNWFLSISCPTWTANYTRHLGDGPHPYGIYDLTSTVGSPPSPPATVTISAASDNAPFA